MYIEIIIKSDKNITKKKNKYPYRERIKIVNQTDQQNGKRNNKSTNLQSLRGNQEKELIKFKNKRNEQEQK